MQEHTAPHKQPGARLGETHCNGCGASTEIVGDLKPAGFYAGYCRHCEHDLSSHDIIAEEVRDLLAEWVECRSHRYTRDELEGAVDTAFDMLRDSIDRAESDAAQA